MHAAHTRLRKSNFSEMIDICILKLGTTPACCCSNERRAVRSRTSSPLSGVKDFPVPGQCNGQCQVGSSLLYAPVPEMQPRSPACRARWTPAVPLTSRMDSIAIRSRISQLQRTWEGRPKERVGRRRQGLSGHAE